MFCKGASVVLAAILLLNLSSVSGEVCVPQNLPDIRHGLGGQLCFKDQKTVVIRGFSFDGGGPDVHLYLYKTGDDPTYTAANVQDTYRHGGGTLIPHPETGGTIPGRRYSGEDLDFSLPNDVYGCDMAVFTVWCRSFGVQFTAIDIPANIFTTSPTEAADGSKILCTRVGGGGVTFENCKQLHPSLSLSWTVDRSAESVLFRLCGCTSSGAEQDNTWLGFGLSGSTTRTLMLGADPTIVWVDEEKGPQAVDYHLSAYTQCRNGVGACPDTEDSSGSCSNDVVVLDGSRDDGRQCVTFSRNYTAGDQCDLALDPDNENQFIVWGVGGLGETAFRHSIRAQNGDDPIHLGRAASSNCEAVQCSSCDPYKNRVIAAPSSTTFVARIGPSGDQRGYMGITGRAGWGIAWYINGTLIPELVVQRGQTYTFIVYGGDNPSDSTNYHPFYITNSISGGRLANTVEESANETVYAGFEGDTPLGVGTLCEYRSNIAAESILTNCNSMLCQYEAALTPPDCEIGGGATFTWTPDDSTPELVYYQCATHLNLGWEINVVDSVEAYVAENNLPDTFTCPVLAGSSVLRASLGLSLPLLILALLNTLQ